MFLIQFVKSFFIGVKDLLLLLPHALVFLIPKIALFFLFMIIITVTGVFDSFLDFLSLDWLDFNNGKENMRGFGD